MTYATIGECTISAVLAPVLEYKPFSVCYDAADCWYSTGTGVCCQLCVKNAVPGHDRAIHEPFRSNLGPVLMSKYSRDPCNLLNRILAVLLEVKNSRDGTKASATSRLSPKFGPSVAPNLSGFKPSHCGISCRWCKHCFIKRH